MILFSDIHMDNEPEFALPWRNGCNSRLLSQLEVLEKIFDIADTYNQSTILFLGDFFDKWNVINTPLMSIVSQTLYDLLDKYPGIYFYMLAGNHDMTNKRSGDVLTVDSFAAHPKIKIIREPMILDIEGLPCAMLPYHQDLNLQRYHMEDLNDKGAHYIFSHIDIIGASACINGYITTNGMPISAFKGYNGGAFGHYHQPQTFKLDTGAIFKYCGSPMQLEKIDSGQDKGVLLLDYTNFEFIPIDSPKFHVLDWTVKINESHFDSLKDKTEDYFIVNCDRKMSGDIRKKLDDLHLNVRLVPKDMTPDLVDREVECPDIQTTPLESFVNTANETLNREALLKYGQHYLGIGV